MPKDFALLEKKIGIVFNNKNLLKQAFTHRSYLNEHPNFPLGHNERLEFLGDAVLELAVTEYLFQKYPQADEGKLTNLRASMVNTQMLSRLAASLGYNDFLLLSKGEESDTNPKARQSILADTFEAVLGALYLDQGFEKAKKFLRPFFDKEIPKIFQSHAYIDPKSRFQEIAQEKYSITPHYKVLDEQGPDHAKVFTVGLYIGDDFVARAKGPSKQSAQMEAARRGLRKKGWDKLEK